MPAREATRFGPDDADPEPVGVHRFLADHSGRLTGLAMAIAGADQPWLFAFHRAALFLLGLPAFVLDMELRPTSRDPAADALAGDRIRGYRQAGAMAVRAFERHAAQLLSHGRHRQAALAAFPGRVVE